MYLTIWTSKMLKIKTNAIFVLCFTKFTTVKSQTLHCDPLDNFSYHKQLAECIKCEKCPVGYGKVTLEESGIEIDQPFGSSSCIPCRPCKQGYYSDVHAYKCKLCTNCTELHKFERKSCTSKEDTVCGEQVLNAENVNVKRIDPNHENTLADGLNLATITVIVSAFVVIMILFGALYVGYRRWKSKRAQYRQSAVQTEAGQNGSNDNKMCSYRPNQEQGEQGTYKELDEIRNYSDTEDDDDDETRPLIQRSGTLRRKRRRLYTYPFCAFQADDSESDGNVCDIDIDTHLSLSKRSSYPDVSFKRVSVESNILDSGFTDFTLRQEPHKILLSFKASGINSMIEKVQAWDCKYDWSEKNIKTHTHSAHTFLATYARGQKRALQKVQQWENKEELSPKFMSKVARYLGPQYKFRSFARELGLSDTDLVNIQQNYKDDVVEQGYQVLLKLKQKELIQTECDVMNKMQDLSFSEIVAKINNHANTSVNIDSSHNRLCAKLSY
ncbi:unnamed protein product [Mytilus coruscus]|uniref:TNFR-Cys domain-containing protein n=1 Tax=Mytilus coruscus TaxID=42192 RepID=A0A6J8ELT1_MYTCO|nr:unnamed protein product [Mytilus coruscus]